MAVGHAGYTEQLKALMPRGRAWPRGQGTVLHALLAGLAAEYARVDGAAEDLLFQVDPRRATSLLPDWERLLGLPDACSPDEAQTLAERRVAAHRKLVSLSSAAPASLLALIEESGFRARIVEHNEARATAIAGIDTSGGRWRFVWWVVLESDVAPRYFDALSGADEPLATYPDTSEIECRLRALQPAHTHLVILTERVQQLALGAHAFASASQLRWGVGAWGPIIAGLVGSSATRWLRLIRIANNTIRVVFEESDTGGFGTIGNDLSADWEASPSAMTIRAGDVEVVIPGPTAPGSVVSDPTEPYEWTPPASTGLAGFRAAWLALTDAERAAATLTLRDGAV